MEGGDAGVHEEVEVGVAGLAAVAAAKVGGEGGGVAAGEELAAVLGHVDELNHG